MTSSCASDKLDTKETFLWRYPNCSGGQKSQNDIWLNQVDSHCWTKTWFLNIILHCFLLSKKCSRWLFGWATCCLVNHAEKILINHNILQLIKLSASRWEVMHGRDRSHQCGVKGSWLYGISYSWEVSLEKPMEQRRNQSPRDTRKGTGGGGQAATPEPEKRTRVLSIKPVKLTCHYIKRTMPGCYIITLTIPF